MEDPEDAMNAMCELALNRIMARLESEGHYGDGFGMTIILFNTSLKSIDLIPSDTSDTSDGILRGVAHQTRTVVFATNIPSNLLFYRTLEYVAGVCNLPKRKRNIDDALYPADQIHRELYHEIGTTECAAPSPELFRRIVGYFEEWRPANLQFIITAGLYYRTMFAASVDRPSVEGVLTRLCQHLKHDGYEQLTESQRDLDTTLN